MEHHKASFWEYDEKRELVNCFLCPQLCHIKEGNLGLCKTRKNIDNTLIANNYGKVSSIALDPIEKKPLYHYKPGSNILSLGTYGCNMKCSFCQNFAISQYEVETKYLNPDDVLKLINQVDNNIGVAFTYNEPFMWYEFVYDTAKLIKQKDKSKDVVIVSNGYINRKPLEAILPYIDALNIDLKTYKETTYRRLCKATLDPVLKTIEIASKKSHVEVTTLMITDENDSLDEIKEIAEFIGKLDPNIPLHLSRYFPNYKMTNKATEVKQILLAKEIAKKYLNYVYVGNVGSIDENTYCPKCGELLIERKYYQVKNHMPLNKCFHCNAEIPIIL